MGEVSTFPVKTLPTACSNTTLKRFVTLNFHKPDESENLKPCQFDLCSHSFPQEHVIFSAAVYSFGIVDLSRLIKGCPEVNTSLKGQVVIR